MELLRISLLSLGLVFLVNIGFAQTPDFTADITVACIGESVTFTNTSTGFSGSETYDWDFGNNASPGSATGPGPHVVTYSNNGNKDINLDVTEGSTYTEFKDNYVVVNSLPPIHDVTGAGSYCSSQSGRVVGIDDSNNGVDYELYLGGAPTGTTVAGNNGSRNFGTQTAGTYTVVADNGTCTRLMNGNAIVTEIADPVVYNVTGTGSYCNGTGGLVVGLDDSESGYDYELYDGGTPTGTIVTGDGNSIDFGSQFAGTYTVEGDNNGCTNMMTGNAVLTQLARPNAYNVTGAGSYCEGSGGRTIGLSDSQSGVDYELYLGGTPTGTIVSGDGSSISFGSQTAGAYTVVADNGNCTRTMNGNAVVTENSLPILYNVTGTGSYCEGAGGRIVGIDDSENGVDYELYLGGTPTGTTVSGNGSTRNFGVQLAGTYTVVGDNNGCSRAMSGNAVVSQLSDPTAYNVTGTGTYCEGAGGLVVGLSGTQNGFDYELYEGGTPTGNIVTGGGVAIDFGNQIDGVYTVVADDGSCTNTMTGNATVTEITLPVIYNVTGTGNYCQGTSGTPVGIDDSESGVDYELYLGGAPTGVTITGNGSARSFGNRTVGTYTVVADNTGCTNSMSGNAVVTEITLPAQYNVTGTGTYCSGTGGRAIGLDNSEGGVNYQLYLGAVPIGSPVSGGGVISFGSHNQGTYTISSERNGCARDMLGNATITETVLPTAHIFGDASVCDGDSSLVYISFTGTASFNITYRIDGTPETPVNSGNNPYSFYASAAGVYDLSAISDANCIGSSLTGSATITINSLPSIDFIPDSLVYKSSDPPIQLSATPVGGTFTGQGVTPIDGVFYPNLADTMPDNNPITYTYTDPGTNCTNESIVDFEIVISDGEIISQSNNVDFIYCSGATEDTLIGVITSTIIDGKFIGNGIVQFAMDSAVFNPQVAGPGVHEVVFSYLTSGGVYFEIRKDFIVDDFGNDRDMASIEDQYCTNSLSFELSADGNIITGTGIPKYYTESYSGIGVSKIGESYFFDPSVGGIGDRTITYTFTRDFTGCELVRDSTITVNDIPIVSWIIRDSCIVFDGSDSTKFYNTSLDTTNITWSWNFGDAASGSQNSSTLKEPWHVYSTTGSKSVILYGINIYSCESFSSKIIDLGEKSKALFDWENECFGDTVNFFAETDGGKIKSFEWDFGDGTFSSDTTVYNLEHYYALEGMYDVSLTVRNQFGCNDTLDQSIAVRPSIDLNNTTYFENFESGNGGWISEANSGSANSWELTLPQGNVINSASSGNYAWVTNATGEYTINEESFVSSPCFNFSGIAKPMIKFNIWADVENDRDGVAFQYSLDDGKNWNTLGSTEDGINWYNSALISANPGGKQLGWTGENQSVWKEARNTLDQLIGESVRFRMVLGTDAVANYEGFAFDNLWIGEREKMVLLEHFTNISSSVCDESNLDVNPIVNNNADVVIDIQYHTSFPGTDELNDFYQAGSSSRAMYYGISTVPYSIEDGIGRFHELVNFGSGLEYEWREENLSLSSLMDPLVNIDLSQSLKTENTICAKAIVEALSQNVLDDHLTLHIVLLEDVGTEENVVRRMLPNTGGTNITGIWNGNEVIVDQSWSSESDISGMRIVAFVQNEITKNVYQASVIEVDDLFIGTGIEDKLSNSQNGSFTIYPNPGDQFCNITFDFEVDDDILNVYNNLGVLVDAIKLEKGIDNVELETKEYPEGIYFIQINQIGIQKLMILH